MTPYALPFLALTDLPLLADLGFPDASLVYDYWT